MSTQVTVTFSTTTSTPSQYIRVCNGDTIIFKPDNASNLDKVIIIEKTQGTSKIIQTIHKIATTFPVISQQISNNKSTIVYEIHAIVNNIYLNDYITTYNISVYEPSVLSVFDTLHLIHTQFIDDADNHLFCIFESENGKVLINTLKQKANRLIMYEKQQIIESIPVFADYINDEIYTIVEPPSFSTDEFIVSEDDTVIFVPLSAQISVIESQATPVIATTDNVTALQKSIADTYNTSINNLQIIDNLSFNNTLNI